MYYQLTLSAASFSVEYERGEQSLLSLSVDETKILRLYNYYNYSRECFDVGSQNVNITNITA